MSQDPHTGRIGERPLSWPCRIAYGIAAALFLYCLLKGTLS